MFGISFYPNKQNVIMDCNVAPGAPDQVIEGAEIYDTICPVSKLTGHRESPFKLLSKISGADSALVNQVLQELPSIASDARLSDEDRVQSLVSRLSTGTPAEDAIMAEKLMADLDALGLKVSSAEDVKEAVKDTIDFAETPNPEAHE